jgi:hypothetical protein
MRLRKASDLRVNRVKKEHVARLEFRVSSLLHIEIVVVV